MRYKCSIFLLLGLIIVSCQNCDLNNKTEIQEVACDQYFHLTGVNQGVFTNMSLFGDTLLFNAGTTTAYNLASNNNMWQKTSMELFTVTNISIGLKTPRSDEHTAELQSRKVS